MKKNEKVFVVRKYVNASSASDAIKKEKKVPVSDVWMDEDFKKSLPSAIGFNS